MKVSLLNSIGLLIVGLMALQLCQAGTIDYVYRSMGPYTGGNTIYITGSSLFGANPANPIVKVNGIDCTLIQASSTHATVVTPANSPAQAMNVDVECYDGTSLISSAVNAFDYIDDEGQILTLDSSSSGGLRVDLGLYYSQAGIDHFVIVDVRSSSGVLPVLKQADSQAAKISTVINIGDSVSNTAGTFYVEPIGSEEQFTIVWEARNAANALLHTSAMAVFEYTNCPAIPDLDGSWGNAGEQVPVPSGVSFTYLPLSNKFQVDISVSYLRNNAAWMFDLTDFLSTDNIRNFRDTTRCASRSSLPSNVVFADYWESAPNAQYGGVTALEGPFNTYPLLGNNVNQAIEGAVWSVSASDCASLTYTAIFTLEQLTNCLERDGVTKSVTVAKINDAGTSLITYSSVLKAHAIRPVDLTDSSAGLEVASYEFPFTYRFTEAVTATSTGSSRSSFDLQVLRGYIDNSLGKQTLTLEVRTVYNPVSGDPNILANPVVSPSQPSTGDLIVGAETNGPASCTSGTACTQTWTFTVDHWVETDNGAYKFTYDVATTSDQVFAFVTVSLHPEFSDVDVSGSLKSELKLYKDESAMKNRNAAFAGSFQPNNVIYGREDVIVAPGDEDQWNLSVQDVYICYTDNPLYIIEWNPTQNKFGCLDGNILASQKRHIIAAGAVDTNSIADFQPAIYAVGDSSLQRPSTFSGAGAFSFLAKPLASTTSGTTGATSRQYSIHVISNIAHVNGNKREVRNMHSIHQYPTKTSMILRDQVPVANDSNPPALAQFAVVQEAVVASSSSSSGAILASSFSSSPSSFSSSSNDNESYSSAAKVMPNLVVLLSLAVFALFFF